MADDRRKELRLDLALPIRYRIIHNQKEIQKLINHKSAGSRNLSAGGLALKVSEPVSKDDIVKLQLQMPEEEKPVLAFAEIVWIEQHGGDSLIGLRFLAIKDQDISRITKFIQAQQKSGATESA